MSIDEIFDVLIDGNDEAIEALAGSGARYMYSPKTGGFRARHGRDFVSACKVYFTPACVALYGNEHTF